MVLQVEAAECALACLTMVANYHGHRVTLSALRTRFGYSPRGLGLRELAEYANSLGLETCTLRVNVAYLREQKGPTVLHWEGNHFVVLRGIVGNVATVHDPALGVLRLRIDGLENKFTGVCLAFRRNRSFAPVRQESRPSLLKILPATKGLKRVLGQLLILTIVIELLALILPLQLRLVIDQIVVLGDGTLLVQSTLLLLVAILFYFFASVSRGWLNNRLGISLSAGWLIRLFNHAIRLPAEYYEARHLGDVLSRFASVNAIQFAITGGLVEVALDGLTAAAIAVIMFSYDTSMASIVVAIFLLTLAIRWSVHPVTMRLNEQLVSLDAKKNSELLESIRGLQAIRIAGKMNNRTIRLYRTVAAFSKQEQVLQNYMTTYVASNQALAALQKLILLSLGAYLVIHGKLTTGTLIAFIAYADIFTWKLGRVINKVYELRLVRVHVCRVADLATRHREVDLGSTTTIQKPTMSFDHVSFRYVQSDNWVLQDVCFDIKAGECVAVVGPSGCGKTTLAKIALGLLMPTHGRVFIGGVELRELDLSSYRKLVAVVMQDDSLFSGSIRENIAFDDEDIDVAMVERVARMVAMHDEIVKMPMAYNTLVGDGGSALSGGQRQRILLARALFKQPDILILDEATSHLDVATERIINRALRELAITKLIIAHRPETIALADRVIDLSETNNLSKKKSQPEMSV